MAFEFKNPSKYQKTSVNIDKQMPSKGDLSEKNILLKLASETATEEQGLSDFMDMKYEIALEKFLENNPGKTENDFIEILRIPMESGGKVIDFAKYAKSRDLKIKGISLASLFTPGKTLADLTTAERDAVNRLLKMTFGKKE
jgi:hypothetical protein